MVAWSRLAEICNQYLRKGSKVYVEGQRLQTRSWEGQDGQKRYTTEVIAREMQMLDSRGDAVGGPEGGAPSASGPASPPEPQSEEPTTTAAKGAPSYSPDDDLPF